MNLARHSLDNAPSTLLHSVTFTEDQRHFFALEESGYSVWRTNPLKLLRRRDLDGTLASVLPLPNTALLALQGGGISPLYPPNKVVIYHDALPTPVKGGPDGMPTDLSSASEALLGRSIASLEFPSKIKGLAARHGSLFVVLIHKVIWFEFGMNPNDDNGAEYTGGFDRKGKGREKSREEGFWIKKRGSWQTCDNERGLIALSTAPRSFLLAIPGRQPGHVQLIQLDRCPTPPSPSDSATSASPISLRPVSSFHSPIVVAHTHPLSHLSTSPSGSTLITASTQGTLLRMWDVETGRLERELRRGLAGADIWGVTFGRRRAASGLGKAGAGHGGGQDKQAERSLVVGWSDKGTIHVWGDPPPPSNQTDPSLSAPSPPKIKKTKVQKLSSMLEPHISLPRYFRSQPSFALFRLSKQMSPAGTGNHTHAFAATTSSAAQREAELDLGGGEVPLSERFVVAWVEVDEEEEGHDRPKRGRGHGDVAGKRPDLTRMGSGASGKEPLRRTGDDAKSDVTSDRAKRRSSDGQPLDRKSSASTHRSHQAGSTKVDTAVTRGASSLQMIAITLGGDWYRLGLPPAGIGDANADDQPHHEDVVGSRARKGSTDPEQRPDRCVLLEYRRMQTSDDGW